MPWVRLDDALGDDPRVATAGVIGVGVLALALGYSNRNLTDGWLPEAVLRRFLNGSTAEAADEAIALLLQSGVLQMEAREGISGYQIQADYVLLQPTRAQVLKQRGERRSQKVAAGRLGGIRSGEARRTRPKQKGSRTEAELKREGSTTEAPFPFPIPKDKSTGEEKSTDAVASAPPPPEVEKSTEASHGLLCKLFHEVWDQEPTRPDRVEAVKKLLPRRHLTAIPEAIHNAEAAVAKIRSAVRASPDRRPGWAQVGS
jgi:hypothetical protein